MLPLHNKRAKSEPSANTQGSYGTETRATSLGNLGSTISTQLANSPLIAEFLGALAMVAIGTVAKCLFGLYSSNGDPWWRTFALGWGFASAIGGWITNSYEGCLNPAVVIASAVFGCMPWKKAFEYISVQVSGAFCGSALAYGLLYSALDRLEGGPNIRTVSKSGEFFAVFDPSRTPGYTCNPAQDLGSRMMLYAMGYGPEVWNHKGWHSWFLAPIVAPVLGGLLGAFMCAKKSYPRRYARILLRLRKEAAPTLKFLTGHKVVWVTIGLDIVFGAAVVLRLAAPEGKEQLSRWLSHAPGLYIGDPHVLGMYTLY
ncbi:hypothetical protein BOTBODRAFT_185317 [Botryobasidium botryosum FD-172 SS1]|uniref:Aquaporin n=1 Tax=Botryobasidium botryosum (strain FD-172 SS1) TaxID=930990 RepID=A0A067MQ95_BOTB1|nr:hypothetical protein BOTBODRAFT_185317 [Botryobasidium botryosum FD-172 SS1]